MLFALAVGIIVAASEAILYLIWTSRKTSSKPGKRRRLPAQAYDKKSEDPAAETADDEPKVIAASSKDEQASTLRQRRDATH